MIFQARWNVFTWGLKWIKFFRYIYIYIYTQFPRSITLISSFSFLSIAADLPAGTRTTLSISWTTFWTFETLFDWLLFDSNNSSFYTVSCVILLVLFCHIVISLYNVSFLIHRTCMLFPFFLAFNWGIPESLLKYAIVMFFSLTYSHMTKSDKFIYIYIYIYIVFSVQYIAFHFLPLPRYQVPDHFPRLTNFFLNLWICVLLAFRFKL